MLVCFKVVSTLLIIISVYVCGIYLIVNCMKPVA